MWSSSWILVWAKSMWLPLPGSESFHTPSPSNCRVLYLFLRGTSWEGEEYTVYSVHIWGYSLLVFSAAICLEAGLASSLWRNLRQGCQSNYVTERSNLSLSLIAGYFSAWQSTHNLLTVYSPDQKVHQAQHTSSPESSTEKSFRHFTE